MTKNVRIENADTSDHKVRVRAQYLNTETGEWADAATEPAVDLTHPTAMSTVTIWKEKRLIVEEIA